MSSESSKKYHSFFADGISAWAALGGPSTNMSATAVVRCFCVVTRARFLHQSEDRNYRMDERLFS